MPRQQVPLSPSIEVKSFSVYYGSKLVLKDVGFTLPKDGITDLISGCRFKRCISFEHKGIYVPTTGLLTLRRRIGMIF